MWLCTATSWIRVPLTASSQLEYLVSSSGERLILLFFFKKIYQVINFFISSLKHCSECSFFYWLCITFFLVFTRTLRGASPAIAQVAVGVRWRCPSTMLWWKWRRRAPPTSLCSRTSSSCPTPRSWLFTPTPLRSGEAESYVKSLLYDTRWTIGVTHLSCGNLNNRWLPSQNFTIPRFTRQTAYWSAR